MTTPRWYSARLEDGSFIVYHDHQPTPAGLRGGLAGLEARAAAAHLNGGHRRACPRSCPLQTNQEED